MFDKTIRGGHVCRYADYVIILKKKKNQANNFTRYVHCIKT